MLVGRATKRSKSNYWTINSTTNYGEYLTQQVAIWLITRRVRTKFLEGSEFLTQWLVQKLFLWLSHKFSILFIFDGTTRVQINSIRHPPTIPTAAQLVKYLVTRTNYPDNRQSIAWSGFWPQISSKKKIRIKETDIKITVHCIFQ